MRKIIDIMAVSSFVVSAAVVSGGVYLYTQKDALIERARERATTAVTEAVSEAIGGALGGGLPGLGGASPVPSPSSPIGSGVPMPF